MATSQNGGQVLQYGDPRLITTVIPGTAGAKLVGGVNGADLNLIFMYIGYRWNREIEPIRSGWCWGHNVRTIRGQTTGYSNHSAGEACDFNAPLHPLGTRTLKAAQLTVLRGMASLMIGVIRFGAFYSGRPDEMHAERIGSYSSVTNLANRIRRGELPNTPAELLSRPGTAPTVPVTVPTTGPTPAGGYAFPGRNLSEGMEGADVACAQEGLNRHAKNLGQAPLVADGKFGHKTYLMLQAYQRARGGAPFYLADDGIIGRHTWDSFGQ